MLHFLCKFETAAQTSFCLYLVIPRRLIYLDWVTRQPMVWCVKLLGLSGREFRTLAPILSFPIPFLRTRTSRTARSCFYVSNDFRPSVGTHNERSGTIRPVLSRTLFLWTWVGQNRIALFCKMRYCLLDEEFDDTVISVKDNIEVSAGELQSHLAKLIARNCLESILWQSSSI